MFLLTWTISQMSSPKYPWGLPSEQVYMHLSPEFNQPSFHVYGPYSEITWYLQCENNDLSPSMDPRAHLPAVSLKDLSRKMQELAVLLNAASQKDILASIFLQRYWRYLGIEA